MICAKYDNGYQLRKIAECLLPRVPRSYPKMQRYTLPRKRFTNSKVLAYKIKILVEIRADITCVILDNIRYPDFVHSLLLEFLDLKTFSVHT